MLIWPRVSVFALDDRPTRRRVLATNGNSVLNIDGLVGLLAGATFVCETTRPRRLRDQALVGVWIGLLLDEEKDG